MLTFSSKTTGVNRVDGTSYKDEPHGIGGLVGFAMPKTGAKLTGLTLDQNVTVAGIFRMRTPPTTAVRIPAPAPIQQKKHAITPSPTKTRARPSGAVGVGGVAGVLDATNLTGTRNAENLKDITNKSTVVGNAFVGGITGNLYSTTENDSDANTLTGLANQGTVLARANTRDVPQAKAACWASSSAALRAARSLYWMSATAPPAAAWSETTLTNLVQAGYNADGTLNENSPSRATLSAAWWALAATSR